MISMTCSARFFSPREKLGFKRLPAEEKAEAFFNLWTRKEAWLKAVGEGIGYALDRVEVSYLPRESARLLALPEAAGPVSRWTSRLLSPLRGSQPPSRWRRHRARFRSFA